MPLVNAQTGETEIGGVHILLTVDAWLMIEQMTGKAALVLLQDVLTMRVGFSDARAILIAGSEGFRRRHASGSQPLSNDRIDRIIEDVGLMHILQDLAECVKGSKALGMRDEEGAADEAAPFGGTGGGSSSAPSGAVSTPSV